MTGVGGVLLKMTSLLVLPPLFGAKFVDFCQF